MPVDSSRVEPAALADGVLASLLDASPHAILHADADGRVLAASRAFGTFFGLAPSEVVGRPLASLAEAWGPAFAEAMTFDEVVAHPLQDHDNGYLRDVEVVRPSHRYLEVSSAPVRRGGAHAGRLWLMRDVTDEREITELKIRYGGQRGADEITSRFLTVAAHRLRTPLTAIRWNLDLLLSDDAALPPESGEALRSAYRGVTGGIAAVDDMLLAVDIERRTLRLERDAADVAEIVARAVREHARAAAMRSQSLRYVEPPTRPAPLFADAAKLEKVFSRLVGNAVAYTPEGGRISVEVTARKDEVEVAVRDTGFGVPEGERARLFGRFYRSQRAMDADPDGSGLGLYISKAVVDAHGGRIAFRPLEGGGSEFAVTLPRRAA